MTGVFFKFHRIKRYFLARNRLQSGTTMTPTALTPSEHIPTLTDLDLECPPLPQTLLEAIQLMERPEPPEPEEVEALLQHDPAAVARLLRVANSAYYGLRGRIGDVRHAIVVLGPPAVVGMVMSMGMLSMKSAFDARTAAPFLNLVRHCAATAYLARLLIQRAPRPATGGRSRPTRPDCCTTLPNFCCFTTSPTRHWPPSSRAPVRVRPKNRRPSLATAWR